MTGSKRSTVSVGVIAAVVSFLFVSVLVLSSGYYELKQMTFMNALNSVLGGP